MTTTPEALAQVIADAESHLGIKPRHIRAAKAVLAHLGERREPAYCVHPDGHAHIVTEEVCDALNAQAAAHGESVRALQVRMLKLETALTAIRDIADVCHDQWSVASRLDIWTLASQALFTELSKKAGK